MTLSFDSTSLGELFMSYPEEDRKDTYLTFCVALQTVPEGSEEARRYHRILDQLALLWQLSDDDCKALMELAQTNREAASSIILRTVAGSSLA
jgi:hypothetical protein